MGLSIYLLVVVSERDSVVFIRRGGLQGSASHSAGQERPPEHFLMMAPLRCPAGRRCSTPKCQRRSTGHLAGSSALPTPALLVLGLVSGVFGYFVMRWPDAPGELLALVVVMVGCPDGCPVH